MATRISVWTYPWDIADEGVGAALDWLQDAGFDAIELCPNYHAISTFSARNRKRSQFYSEQGAVYFPARVERYGRIKPKVFDEPEVLKAYGSASAELESRGMELNAWVIGMFQPWMARRYPDVAIENAFGHRSYAQTCPASPDVQEYLAALVADACDQFNISGATLESVGHPPFAYGWVRERILINMSAWTQFLAGLCFCENCTSAARAHGVDALAVRGSIAEELRERIEGSVDDPPREDVAAMAAERSSSDELLRGFLESRDQTASAIVKSVSHPLQKARIRVGVTDASSGWSLRGLRLPDLLATVGAVMIPPPDEQLDEARAQVDLIRASDHDVLVTVNEQGYAWARPNGPELEARAERLAELGVDRVMIYNFGLVTPPTLRRIGAVMRDALVPKSTGRASDPPAT